jgi:hypothetical protein
MMVRFAVTADKATAQVLDELKTLPLETRKKDPRVLFIVQEMKNRWSSGTKIERLATLGWLEYDSIRIFCEMLDNLDILRKQYLENVMLNGLPPDLKDEDIQEYEKAIWKENEEIKKVTKRT